MKIYFAGSIKGGRENVHIYKKIIDLLKEYGEVLTEHVGDEKYLSVSEEDGVPADRYIYNRDTKWISQSDYFIADVSIPSTGVGYEIGHAEALGKKVFCLYREGSAKPLSLMISGNENFTVKSYKELEELPEIFKTFFK